MEQIADFHHNFNRFFDSLGLQRRHTGRTETMPIAPNLGEGAIYRYVPRCDMELIVSDYTLHQDHTLQLQTDSPMVELSYCFQGERTAHITGERYEYAQDSCILQFVDSAEARFEFGAGVPFSMVGIGIPAATFQHFIDGADRGRTLDFGRITGGGSYKMFSGPIEPTPAVVLRRLLQAVSAGETRNLELEIRILELLSSAFGRFLFDGKEEAQAAGLTKTDMAKIRQARDILLRRMTEPPKLLELARMIGMNDFKLKAGFKEMFGTTLFGYLREKRLEKAYYLLQQESISVTEACCEVGYSNPSYFAEAFREKYGINPGAFVRRRHCGEGSPSRPDFPSVR